ncbi:hypothetical protein QCB44_06675 [Thiomicrorhabdus sp. zzn3]|uniref:hypothetical protein n=1 Tax=Thiomicrorhabdus sp. zzn3 TaxID=3039775 RepID=UPI00243651A1|nr:hypothetical protein [Thiomicrorhabdus sp. zzn3]MDG6778382.1 hypothetical protein [Thiomicrorhabdus sp. zzn3]
MIALWLSVLIGLLSAYLCHRTAQRKGRPAVFWGTMGLLFGPFAWLVLVLLKQHNPENRESN